MIAKFFKDGKKLIIRRAAQPTTPNTYEKHHNLKSYKLHELKIPGPKRQFIRLERKNIFDILA